MKALDPARLRQARLAELSYVQRDLATEVALSLARARTALAELTAEIERSRELVRR